MVSDKFDDVEKKRHKSQSDDVSIDNEIMIKKKKEITYFETILMEIFYNK